MAEDTFTMEDAEAAVKTAAPDSQSDSAIDKFNEAVGLESPPEPEAMPEPEATPEPEPEVKESRSAKDFKLVKQKAREAASEVEKLKAEISALKTHAPEVDGELDTLRKERDELSSRLKTAALEKHPEFESYYRNKLSGYVDRAKALVGEELGGRVEQLLNMSGGEYRNNGLEELFSELSTTQSAQLGAILTNMDEVVFERSNKLQNASQTVEQMGANQAQQREAYMAESEKTFSRVGEEAKAWGVFQERKDDDDWNNALAERNAVAKAIYMGESDPEQLARAAYMASSADYLNELLAKEVEAHRLTKTQLSELQGTNPAVSTGANGASVGETDDFMSAFAKSQQQ